MSRECEKNKETASYSSCSESAQENLISNNDKNEVGDDTPCKSQEQDFSEHEVFYSESANEYAKSVYYLVKQYRQAVKKEGSITKKPFIRLYCESDSQSENESDGISNAARALKHWESLFCPNKRKKKPKYPFPIISDSSDDDTSNTSESKCPSGLSCSKDSVKKKDRSKPSTSSETSVFDTYDIDYNLSLGYEKLQEAMDKAEAVAAGKNNCTGASVEDSNCSDELVVKIDDPDPLSDFERMTVADFQDLCSDDNADFGNTFEGDDSEHANNFIKRKRKLSDN